MATINTTGHDDAQGDEDQLDDPGVGMPRILPSQGKGHAKDERRLRVPATASTHVQRTTR